MRTGRQRWHLKARLVRFWLGEWFLPVVTFATLFCTVVPTVIALRSDLRSVILAVSLTSLLLAMVIWLGGGRLHRWLFDRPADSGLIADRLALEPSHIRDRVIERHASWRRATPVGLLPIAIVDGWCRTAASDYAVENQPVLPGYNAAAAQDRGFLNINPES